MSSWIVDKGCIDLLVEAFFKHEIPTATPLTPDALGTLLWKANHTGVNYRYHRRKAAPKYTHNRDAVLCSDYPHRRLGDVRTCARDNLLVYQQIARFQYQSCAHPTYDSIPASTLMTALASSILKAEGLSPSEAWDIFDENRDAYPWIIYTEGA